MLTGDRAVVNVVEQEEGAGELSGFESTSGEHEFHDHSFKVDHLAFKWWIDQKKN